MHYALNESLDKSCKSQLTFMKKNLYDVSQFRQDRDTLMEQKNQDKCGVGTASKPPYRAKQSRAPQSMETKHGENS